MDNKELSAEEYIQNRLAKEQFDWCLSENEAREFANLRVKEKLQQIRESLLIKRPLSNGCSLEGVTYGQAWGIDNAIELIDNQINLNKE